jgi:hypothetical protein
MFRKRRISVDVMSKTIYGIHLKFRRYFEFLKKVFFCKSLVQNKKNAKKRFEKEAFLCTLCRKPDIFSSQKEKNKKQN